MRNAVHLSSSDIERPDSEYSNSIQVDPSSKTAATYTNSNISVAPTKPAILLIHPRPFHRECFARCLQSAYGDHAVFSFDSMAGWHNSAEALELTPSVAIIVVESAHASDLADSESLKDAPENVPLIVVSDIDDSDQIIRTLRSGVRGYIPTNLPLSVVIEAVRLVGAGGIFVPASSFLDQERPAASAKSGVKVTKREMSVIEEVRRGKANKQVAYELGISEHTVKLHLRRIMKKFKARNRTEVAVLCKNVVAT